MLSKILSAAHFGLETIPVEVEVNINLWKKKLKRRKQKREAFPRDETLW